MLAVLAVCVVVLAVLGLGFYAVSKMRPRSFRLRTTLWRVLSFSLEIESSETAGKLTDGQGLGSAGASSEGAGGRKLAAPPAPPSKG